ncbi:MAG: hypothetical protein ACREF4_06065, partial [Gammaproteobacteria bacterium]
MNGSTTTAEDEAAADGGDQRFLDSQSPVNTSIARSMTIPRRRHDQLENQGSAISEPDEESPRAPPGECPRTQASTSTIGSPSRARMTMPLVTHAGRYKAGTVKVARSVTRPA